MVAVPLRWSRREQLRDNFYHARLIERRGPVEANASPLSSAVRRLYGSLPPPNLSALSRSFYRVTSCGLIKEPLVTPVHFYSAAQHLGLRVCIGSGQSGIPQSDRGRAMQDAVSELPRILLPRTWVNKGSRKGRGSTPRPSPLLASVLSVPALS